nr:hypothetical protein [Tanacetum cinerariifolium]
MYKNLWHFPVFTYTVELAACTLTHEQPRIRSKLRKMHPCQLGDTCDYESNLMLQKTKPDATHGCRQASFIIVKNSLEVLKVLKNSLEVLKVLKNSLDMLKVLQMELQENSSIDEVGELHLLLHNYTQKLHVAPYSPFLCGCDENHREEEYQEGNNSSGIETLTYHVLATYGVTYDAESLDEAAFVIVARELGFDVYKRIQTTMNRDVITVGSTMRIPLLYRDEYSQWRERFMNYLEEQTDGEEIINSIQNGDHPLRVVAQVSLPGTAQNAPPTFKDPINDTAKDLWDALERQMCGLSDVNDASGYKNKAIVVTSDPLLLVAEKTKVCKRKEKVAVQSESEGSDDEYISDLKKITALLAKAFNRKKYYAKPINNNLRTSSASSSANKKPEYVKSVETKEDKKDNEKKRDISKAKCYNCKKEGHFIKDCKKAKVKDYNYYKTKMLLTKKDNDKQIQTKVLHPLKNIAEVIYYISESESESEYETLEYYDNSINYGLFVNDDDDQNFFYDAIESASENFNKNHIVSQKDYDESEVDHNDSEEKDHLVNKLIQKFNHKIAKCHKYDYFQEIINPYFEKIDYPFQQTNSLKPYVPTVILEKIIIDLEDEVVSLLEKEKENLEITESLKSKGFESSENAISESKNQSENDFQVVEQGCEQVKNSKIVQIYLWIIDSGCSKHMTGNRALLTNFVEKFLGTVCFGNTDFAVIAGYGDVVIGSMTIKKVYYVEGLGHNLFSVGQFCDKGLENKTLAKFFDEVGITQQFSAARTPQQNGVVKRRNGTLVEAARTMLTFVNLPLFLWAEAIGTTCFIENCSIIHKRFDKTPYELMNKRKPNIKFFHVLRCRCYLLNGYDDVGKLKEKRDIGVFVGYSKESTAFRIYNKRTRKIQESVNVNFDEISEMASKQFSLEPDLSNLNKTGKSSNPSVLQVSETSKKDLEDLFHNFYDEYFDASKIMKSSTLNVETSNVKIPSHEEEVFHESSE